VKNSKMMGILMLTGSFAVTGCAGYSMTADNPQHFAPESHPALVTHDMPPAGAVNLGRVYDIKNYLYGGVGGCEEDLSRAVAARLGANFVQITKEGHKLTLTSWSAPYCEGIAFRVAANSPLMLARSLLARSRYNGQ
jgi:hypothetical protein